MLPSQGGDTGPNPVGSTKFFGGVDKLVIVPGLSNRSFAGSSPVASAIFHCLLAQLVERKTLNLEVLGSSPREASIFSGDGKWSARRL